MKDKDMAVLLPCSKDDKDEIFELICMLTDDELDKVGIYIENLKNTRKTSK